MRCLLFWFCLLLLTGSATAQQEGIAEKYDYGKSLLEREQLPQAYEVFKALEREAQGSAYAPYALYFHALTAYRTGRYPEAKLQLTRLTNSHSAWEQIDEGRYLLGLVCIDMQDIDEGLAHLANLREPSAIKASNALKKNKLQSLSLNRLERLCEQYPQDEVIAEVCYARYLSEPGEQRGLLFRQLDQRLSHLRKAPAAAIQPEAPAKAARNQYHVALLLPFQEKTIDPYASQRRSQLAIDLYAGMQVAVSQLAEEGVQLVLHAYDVERDTLGLATILREPVMRDIDLIVGPLHTQTLGQVKSYAAAQQTFMVNPISSNSIITQDSRHSFLLSSSQETQARQTARYALSTGRSVAFIVHGPNRQEQQQAEMYRQYIEQNGGRVAVMHSFGSSKQYGALVEKLAGINKDSLSSHIYVTSTDPVLALSILSAAQSLRATAPIFVPAEWMEFQQITFNQMANANVHFVAPFYADPDTPGYRKFVTDFARMHNTVPSQQAAMGFEALHFFGKMLAQYGPERLGEALRSADPRPGMLMPLLDYRQANDNQHVPIIHLRNGQIEIVNTR